MDDIIITGPNARLVHKIEEKLASQFKMTDGCDISFITGIRITTEADGSIRMDQDHYMKQLLKKYGMLDM